MKIESAVMNTPVYTEPANRPKPEAQTAPMETVAPEVQMQVQQEQLS